MNESSDINGSLVQQQSLLNRKIPNYIFSQLIKEFKIYYIAALAMNLLLFSLFTVQYIRQCSDSYLATWMLCSSIIFFIQFIFYIMVIYPTFNAQRIYYFAEQLHEVIFFGDQDPYYQLSRQDRIKKRKRLEQIIKSHFKYYKKGYWYIDILLTIGDLTLAILGVVLFSINDYFKFMLTLHKAEGFSDDCQFSSAWIIFWSIVLLCISRKNAFQLVLIGIISMPFIVCLLPIKLMKQNKQKQIKNLQCLNIIQSFKYHPNTLQGDEHSCSICRIDYSLGVNIKVLPCSSLHHFHSSCIKAWFKISPSCPLCRKELGKIIDDMRSINGAPSYLVLDYQNSEVNNDLGSQQNIEQNNQIENENLINAQQNQSDSQINQSENQLS
ncbi:hypothetical protein ABPG72_008967 [Tetrahymena utriculariae]